MADFGFGSSAVGFALLGELGAEATGIHTWRDRQLLLQWDALLAARGGALGNTYPLTTLLGGVGAGFVEAGYRLQHRARWSFYAGGRLSGDLSILPRPGSSLAELNSLNNLDGVGGLSAHGAIRVAAGASFLDGKRSLLLTAFFQEEGRARAVYTPGDAFAEGGIAGRFDLADRLTASVEVRAGRGLVSTESALATTDQTTYVAFTALLRWVFRDGVWLALSGDLSRQFDHRIYTSTGNTYNTADAPAFDLQLTCGVPFLWKNKRGYAP